MKVAHTLGLLGVNLAVSACVAGPPPGPMGVVAPGKDKSQAAFQQDQSVCQQHAVAQTGYGNASQNPADHLPADGTLPGSAGGSASAAVPSGTAPPGEVSYLQCMAARGNIVQLASAGGYYDGYSYPYPYPYGYGYPYYGRINHRLVAGVDGTAGAGATAGGVMDIGVAAVGATGAGAAGVGVTAVGATEVGVTEVGATAAAADTVEPRIRAVRLRIWLPSEPSHDQIGQGRAAIHPGSHRAITRNPLRRARGEASSGKSSGKSGDWSRAP